MSADLNATRPAAHKPRSSKADLPKWKTESDEAISVRYHCNRCIRHFETEDRAQDHVNRMHKEAA